MSYYSEKLPWYVDEGIKMLDRLYAELEPSHPLFDRVGVVIWMLKGDLDPNLEPKP